MEKFIHIVLDLKPALSIVDIRDRWSIGNHIGTINVGAMCSLAELSAGLAIDSAIPKHLR